MKFNFSNLNIFSYFLDNGYSTLSIKLKKSDIDTKIDLLDNSQSYVKWAKYEFIEIIGSDGI